MRFTLFAARDGDVIEETICAPDEQEARLIAAHRIVDAFSLDFLEEYDFEEVSAETDGVRLDELRSSETNEIVSAWAYAQLPFLAHLQNKCDEKLAGELRRCNSALASLVRAVDKLSAAREN